MFAPITANEVTLVLNGSPILTTVHFSPRLLERITALPATAKTSVPTAATSSMPKLDKPVSNAIQLFPWSSDRKTLPALKGKGSPANMSVPTVAREETTAFGGKPVLAATQPLPSSNDRKTPPPRVPTTIFVPLTASAVIFRLVKPALTATHLSS